MELYIDTTKHGYIKLQILDGRRIVVKSRKKTRKISETLLSEIEKIMKKTQVKFSQLTKITVNPGPGGFSSTRTGVATANALNFVLGDERIVLPKYDKEPNITRPKS